MWLSAVVNVVIVAVLSGLAMIVDSDAARGVLVGAAALTSGLAHWGLVAYPWSGVVDRAKWDARQEYVEKVREANARITEANAYKASADRRVEAAEAARMAEASAGVRCRNRLAQQGVHIDNDWNIVRLPECPREHR